MVGASTMKFLKNLHAIASSDEHPAIEWNKAGNGVVIVDKNRFMRESLPSICKSDEYGTFIRQLNNYGFSKTKTNGRDEFINENFSKDSPDSLMFIRRKNFSERQSTDLTMLQQSQYQLHSNVCTISEINKQLMHELYYLKEKVNQHEKAINDLVRAFIRVFNKQDQILKVPSLEKGGKKEEKREDEDLLKEVSDTSTSLSLNPLPATHDPASEYNTPEDIDIDEFLNETYKDEMQK